MMQFSSAMLHLDMTAESFILYRYRHKSARYRIYLHLPHGFISRFVQKPFRLFKAKKIKKYIHTEKKKGRKKTKFICSPRRHLFFIHIVQIILEREKRGNYAQRTETNATNPNNKTSYHCIQQQQQKMCEFKSNNLQIGVRCSVFFIGTFYAFLQLLQSLFAFTQISFSSLACAFNSRIKDDATPIAAFSTLTMPM